jgi:hypothetical protein
MLCHLMPRQEGLWGLRLHSYVDFNFHFKFLICVLKRDRSSLIGSRSLSPQLEYVIQCPSSEVE